MGTLSGNCCIPFGLFGSNVPQHIITSIDIIGDEFIVTGDEIGQVIVWKMSNLGDVEIYWYLIGHNGKISNICSIPNSGDDAENRCCVTFSTLREIAIWNCVDGRCVRFERQITLDHLFVMSYKPANRASSLLLCCGKYSGVALLDSMTLRSTISLKSQGYPNWIQSVCAFEHQAGVHVVLGLSVVGAAILWTIDHLDGSAELQVIYETESRMLTLSVSPLMISMCPSKPRFVLVTSPSAVQIYDAANWTVFCEMECFEGPSFQAGKFLDKKNILLQFKNGSIHLYQLPVALDSGFETRLDMSLDLIHGGLLGTMDCNNLCIALNVRNEEITVVWGHGSGLVDMWRFNLNVVDPNNFLEHISDQLSFSMEKQWSQKKFLSITDPLNHLWKVSCCHFPQANNSLILGMENGDIVITDKLHMVCATFFQKNTSSVLHRVLRGHTLRVLSLFYEETSVDDKKNPWQWVWSGSADFSVRLWEFESEKCVKIFHCHSGPVKCIIKSPMLGLTRAKDEGRIRAQKNKENSELEALKPINFSSWLGPHVYVSFDCDNGIAFLSLETKRVVLRVQFESEIISVSWRKEHILSLVECADGSVTIWELGASEMDRRVSGQLAKDILDSGTDRAVIKNIISSPAISSLVTDRSKRPYGSSLMLYNFRSSLDNCSQVLLIDTEGILVDLYNAQVEANGLPRAFIEAQLLLTLVNEWGYDICLDKTLESTLGLVSISSLVSSGHMSSRFATMSFQLNKDFNRNPILCSQKLLAGVAVCYALNNLPEKLKNYPWLRLSQYLSNMETLVVSDISASVDNRTSMRQVCCLFATSLVTSTLPKLLCDENHSLQIRMSITQFVLQQFLQKYQDRCLEIREAARTLFNASMDSLTIEQRTEVVQRWVIQSRILEYSDDVPPDKTQDFHRSSLSSIKDMPVISDWRGANWTLGELYDSKEISRMQVITIAFLAAVGSRYGSSDALSPVGSNTVSPVFGKPACQTEKTIPGFGIEDYRLARITCGHLMRLVCFTPQNSIQWPEMRRLALSLLGQGFPVWEPYLEVGTLFTKLLENVSGSEKIIGGWNQGQLLTDEIDACRSAKSALLSIALSRPKVFATVLSREVLKLQMQSTPSTNPVQIANGASTQSNSSQPPLLAARHEVIEIIKVLCERKTREIHEVFPEIMDILLACLNKLELRHYDLQQLFPPILLFRIASSHTASGKVCVGTRTGHVVFYDVKLGKYNTSSGHTSAVTSVTFSPDGKQVASYSMPDNSVCIWQLFSSGLFGMGSSHQVKLISHLNVPPVAVSKTVSEEDSGLLANTNFKLRLFAANSFGLGEPSSQSEIFKTEAIPPQKSPQNVTGGGGKVGTLVIRWEPLLPLEENGDNFEYEIQYKEAKEVEWISNTGFLNKSLDNGKYLQVTLDLPANKDYIPYHVKVRAKNIKGDGPWSAVSTITSSSKLPSFAPLNINADSLNSTAINVQWIAPSIGQGEGPIQGYHIVYWMRVSDCKSQAASYDRLNTSQRLTLYGTDLTKGIIIGLQPDRYYCIGVQMFNTAGDSLESSFVDQTTFKMPPQNFPTIVRLNSTNTPHQIQVTWNGVRVMPEEESVDGYRIRYWLSGGPVRTALDVDVGLKVTGYINDLQYDVRYNMRIFAYSRGGNGKLSDP